METQNHGGGGDAENPPTTDDAISGAIKDQTDAIKEQTEVNKNIFQQILELPR